MLQKLRQVYTKSCNYKIANNLDHVQTSRCVHIHHVQTRHCVHIHHVQTSTFLVDRMIFGGTLVIGFIAKIKCNYFFWGLIWSNWPAVEQIGHNVLFSGLIRPRHLVLIYLIPLQLDFTPNWVLLNSQGQSCVVYSVLCLQCSLYLQRFSILESIVQLIIKRVASLSKKQFTVMQRLLFVSYCPLILQG